MGDICELCGSRFVEEYYFACLVCNDYRLCLGCYDSGSPYSLGHTENHPMYRVVVELNEEDKKLGDVDKDDDIDRRKTVYLLNLAKTQITEGEIGYTRGNYSEAIHYLEEALLALKNGLQTKSSEYMKCVSLLCRTYSCMDNNEKALTLCKEKLVVLQEEFPDDLERQHDTNEEIIAYFIKLGRLEEAISFCHKDLELVQKRWGKISHQYAETMHTLAYLKKELFMYDESISLYEETMEIKIELVGTAQPDYSICLNNLAVLHFGRKEYEESEKLYLKACEKMKEGIGESHPSYVTFLYNIASLYHIVGKDELRDKFLQKAIHLSGKEFEHFEDLEPFEGEDAEKADMSREPKEFLRSRSSVFRSVEIGTISEDIQKRLVDAISGGSDEIYEILLIDEKKRAAEYADQVERKRYRCHELYHEFPLEFLRRNFESVKIDFLGYIPLSKKRALGWLPSRLTKLFGKIVVEMVSDPLIKYSFSTFLSKIQFIVSPSELIERIYPNESPGNEGKVTIFERETEKMKLFCRYEQEQGLISLLYEHEGKQKSLPADFSHLMQELLMDVMSKGLELSVIYRGKLPKTPDRRSKIIKELITTEHHYVVLLEQLIVGYLEPLREEAKKKSFITSEQVSSLFSNLEFVLQGNKDFYEEIISQTSNVRSLNQIDLSSAFDARFPLMKNAYSWYNAQYSKALRMESELSARKDFVDFCDKRKRLIHHSLESLLVLPVQRLARYELLLKDMLRISDPQDNRLNLTLGKLTQLNDEINTNIRAKENQLRLIELGNVIEMDAKHSLIAPHRLVLTADFKKMYVSSPFEEGNIPAVILLFNDILALVEPKVKGKHRLMRVLSLDKMKTNKISDSSFVIIHPDCSFNVFATHPIDQFLNSIDEAIKVERERISAYVAIQIKELGKSQVKTKTS